MKKIFIITIAFTVIFFALVIKNAHSKINSSSTSFSYFSMDQISKKNSNAEIEVPILVYHDVAPWPIQAFNLTKSLTIKPEDFEKQMKYLYDHGFTPITLQELKAIWDGVKEPPKKPIVLTFDDGDKGVFKYAFPILKKYKFYFVIFLITKYTNYHTNFYMNKDEILEMVRSSLVEVGSHTRDHVNLKKVDYKKAYFEICSSKSDIKKYAGLNTTSFCYPFGGYSETAIKALKYCGFTLATTENYGFASDKQNPFLLKRIRIDGRDSLGIFIEKISKF